MDNDRFFELSIDLLGILDANGQILRANPAWEQLLSRDDQPSVGFSFLDVIHADDRFGVESKLLEISAKRAPLTFEARCQRGNGQIVWISWNATPSDDDDTIYVVGRDITELKRSEQRFRGLLQATPDALVVVERNGRIVMVNAQTERVFRYRRDQLIGKPLDMLMPGRFRDQHAAHLTHFFQTATVRPMGTGMKLYALRGDGTEFRAEIALSPFDIENGRLVCAAVRDISDR